MKKEKIFLFYIFVFSAIFILSSCEGRHDITGMWSSGLYHKGFADRLTFFSDGTGIAGEETMSWEAWRKRLIIEKGTNTAKRTMIFTFEIYTDSAGGRVLKLTDSGGAISLYFKR